MKPERIIMGIDPGTNLLGYAIIGVSGSQVQVIGLGVLKLAIYQDPYIKLREIFTRVLALIDQYKPDDLAIEAPFYGKNVQSMLKLGRAQGVCMAAALYRSIPVTEYSPRRVKQSITGKGAASKEQVSGMLHHLVQFDAAPYTLDATDALAVAICHHQSGSSQVKSAGNYSGWDAFIKSNPGRVKSPPADKEGK
ncbi:MAG TPA: crossover junction endodeoxyribonuclease RuvC [Bacteroidales bacterium]|nr:crossover junction endodeoxyribonuclease RuvC [Bacteroidales bacterium]HRZ48789.1 crossover junction endodeoxyribonuclease RuvC [Bacteroidales bacterium]